MQNKLPTLNGISPSKCYLPNLKELAFIPNTVFEFLCVKFSNISQDEWQNRFNHQLIFVEINNQFINLTITDLYQNFQNKTIFYYRKVNNEIKIPFDDTILFENDYILAVDKPHFLPMTPAGNYVKQTLLTRLKDRTGIDDLTPIHRLDKETAGVVLFCKDKQYRNMYQSLFEKRQIKKIYHAIAPFNANLIFPIELNLYLERGNPFYTMQVGNHPANSQTMIELLQIDDNKEWAKYQLQPTTGKLHQLRVHLNYLSIPIKNDPYYPSVCHKDDSDFNNPLQLLAKSLEFLDPVTKSPFCFASKHELFL